MIFINDVFLNNICYETLMDNVKLSLLSTRITINDIIILNIYIDCPQMLSVLNIRFSVRSTLDSPIFSSKTTTARTIHTTHWTANNYTDLSIAFKPLLLTTKQKYLVLNKCDVKWIYFNLRCTMIFDIFSTDEPTEFLNHLLWYTYVIEALRAFYKCIFASLCLALWL